ncbi:hypothetical protein C8J57DRAFT_1225342 [Mycena rebaudengoi]|nr:hypothetical protein C8J57DRAFT_1225342 [Mycena rebaudengoi]
MCNKTYFMYTFFCLLCGYSSLIEAVQGWAGLGRDQFPPNPQFRTIPLPGDKPGWWVHLARHTLLHYGYGKIKTYGHAGSEINYIMYDNIWVLFFQGTCQDPISSITRKRTDCQNLYRGVEQI